MRALPALVGSIAMVGAAACRPAPTPLDSCRDPLAGVWRVDAPAGATTTPSGEPRRYHALEVGYGSIELDPMFDDSVLVPGARKDAGPDAVIVAPAVVDLTRTGDGDALVGSLVRRFHRGGARCALHGPARLRDCRGDRATLELAAVGPPADWTGCVPSPATPGVWSLVRERD